MPPELVEELDELREQDESRSATIRRLIRKGRDRSNEKSDKHASEEAADE